MLGEPLRVEYLKEEPLFPEQRRTAAQQAGINFEKAAARKLAQLYVKVVSGPWLRYYSPKKWGICQPDVLVWLTPQHLLVIEVKLSWMPQVRQKLLTLYGPLIQKLHPEATLSYLQLYKNWKPKSHKKPLSIYALDDIKEGAYKECQFLGL